MTGRIRTIKPEWLEDELLAGASNEARVLSVGLILMADDYGRGRANIATIASDVWRFAMAQDDGAHAAEVLAMASRAFRELLAMRFVIDYEVDRQRYFAIRNWNKHQKVDRPSKPRIPAPSEAETPTKSDHRETLASVPREVGEALATPSRLTCTSDLRPVPANTTQPPPVADSSFNRRVLERVVGEVRGRPWSVPKQRFAMAARADEVVEEIREMAARLSNAQLEVTPDDLCAAAFERWVEYREKRNESTQPHLWLDDWAGQLPPPPKPKEVWRDLEG